MSKIVDSPVPLGSIVLERVLNDSGSTSSRQLHGSILAVGIHHEDLIGDQTGTAERVAQGFFGVEGEHDDSWSHKDLNRAFRGESGPSLE